MQLFLWSSQGEFIVTTLDSHISAKFKVAIALTTVTLVAEVAGGLWTNSLALLSDAAHVFLDLFALVLSLTAVQLAALPTSERHTYGFHRSEVFASFINGLTVFLMGIGILYEAWGRFAAPEPVKSGPMLLIAVSIEYFSGISGGGKGVQLTGWPKQKKADSWCRPL